MKKTISYILISLIVFANLFAPISVGWGSKNGVEIQKNEVSAANCVFKDVSFETTSTIDDKRKDQVILNITTTECAGNKISGTITTKSGLFSKDLLVIHPQITTSDKFSLIIKTGEKDCSSNTCEAKLSLMMSDVNTGRKLDSYESSSNKDSISFKCTSDNGCDNTIEWGIVSSDSIIPNTDISFGIAPSVTNNSVTMSGQSSVLTTFPIESTLTATLLNSDNSPVENGIKIFDINKQLLKNGRASYSVTFSGLQAATKYNFILTPSDNTNIKEAVMSGITTLSETNQIVTPLPNAIQGSDPIQNTRRSNMPACGSGLNPTSDAGPLGCVAQIFYYVIFQPTSYLFALTGKFFDYTFSYSVQDTSYRSSFVVEGWGLVRDFCNMFFIFIMLYVAIGTTLSLHSMKTKETIVNVVIIGLFINFSLLATQIIIDASNVTARVFYNSDAIKITEKGPTGAAEVIADIGPGGVIPLSAALVNKINPQNILINSKEINKINDVSTSAFKNVDQSSADGIGVGQFILLVLLASAVNIVGLTVFMSVGLIFLARVIGLWIAMILAPLAFFTYILPEMSGMKMIGWKNWWPETLKLAFLAPIFIFFMYIILKFLQMDLISDAKGKEGLDFFIAALIPLAFVMILMTKAKKIATDLSGELGQQITSKLAMAGGLALGAATGGAALMGRATLGRLGNKIANSEALKSAESKGVFGAKMLRNIGTSASKGSFDARNTKAGAAFSKETGMDLSGKETGMGGLIKANQGGFAQVRSDKLAARTKRAKELELGEDSKEKQKLNMAQAMLKKLENDSEPEIHALDGKIKAKQLDSTDKSRRASNLESIAKKKDATDADKAAAIKARDEAIEADKDLQDAKNQKNAIRSGSGVEIEEHGKKTGKFKYYTDNGNISKTASEKLIKDTEEEAEEAEKAAEAKAKEAEAAEAKAKEAENWSSQVQDDPDIEQVHKNIAKADAEAARAAAGVAKATSDEAKALSDTAKVKHENAQNIHNQLTKDDNFGKSMNTIEYEDVHHAKQEYDKENNGRKFVYADYIQNNKWNKAANFISSGGAHSFYGDREAGHKIRMNVVAEKSGGGGHAAGGQADSHAHAPKAEKHDKEHDNGHPPAKGDDHGHEHGK